MSVRLLFFLRTLKRSLTFFQKVWQKTNDASAKAKPKGPKFKLPAPSPSPSPAPLPRSRRESTATRQTPSDINLDDELLQTVDATPSVAHHPVSAVMKEEDDLDDLLLGSTTPTLEVPKSVAPAPAPVVADDDLDLDAELWDAADALGGPDDEFDLPTPSTSTNHAIADIIEPSKPRLKMTLGRRDSPALSTTPSITDGASASRKRARDSEYAQSPVPILPAPAPVASTSQHYVAPVLASRPSSSHVELANPSSPPMDAPNTKKCRDLLQKLTDVEYGWIFANPVDSTQPGLEKYVFLSLTSFRLCSPT